MGSLKVGKRPFSQLDELGIAGCKCYLEVQQFPEASLWFGLADEVKRAKILLNKTCQAVPSHSVTAKERPLGLIPRIGPIVLTSDASTAHDRAKRNAMLAEGSLSEGQVGGVWRSQQEGQK